MLHAEVRSLAIHGTYRCQNAGACCTSNWPIPIEADRLLALQSALASNRVRPATGDVASAVQSIANAPPDAAALLGRGPRTGDPGPRTICCVFYDPAAPAGRCRIHSALGHSALPLACRQFPRVSVIDPRGVSVTLSHYCPTAAALLEAEADREPSIVLNAPAFPSASEYVGLDAQRAWPPLVRPDLLMDWDSWWECERLAVEMFDADRNESAAVTLARLRAAVEDLQRWSPSDGPLIDRVADAFARAQHTTPAPFVATQDRVDAVFRSIPEDIRPARFTESVITSDRATRRFLAAHAFANWSVHSEKGLGGWLRSIETAAALLAAGAGVRNADLLLRHLVIDQ